MFWMKAKAAAAVMCVIAAVSPGGVVAVPELDGPEESQAKAEKKGVLAGLPSAPGPTLARIKALKDGQWLNLGPPAADPRWGSARGRSWSSKMPYAPDL